MPKIFRSQSTTPMTTTPFKIDLMLPAMGMKRFTSHKRKPTTMRTRRTLRIGIVVFFSVCVARHISPDASGLHGEMLGCCQQEFSFTACSFWPLQEHKSVHLCTSLKFRGTRVEGVAMPSRTGEGRSRFDSTVNGGPEDVELS